MKKIEAIIRPEKLEELKDAFLEYKISGVTISQVMGCGKQRGWTEYVRGSEILINMLPKFVVTLVVKDKCVDEIVDIIIKTSQTGEVGDGKIFVTDVVDCIRIRTGEKGEKAL